MSNSHGRSAWSSRHSPAASKASPPREAGALVCETLNAFEDYTKILTMLRGRRVAGRRLGVITNAGFEAGAASDHMYGLEMANFADATRAPGIAEFDVPLPAEPGVVAGRAELLGSEQTLSFFLDVRDPAGSVATLQSQPSGLPGWPFLLLAGLIVLVAMIAVSRRRTEPATP